MSRILKKSIKLSAALVAVLAALRAPSVMASTLTWDGAAGTVAGTTNTGLPTQASLGYYLWDTTTANWSGSTYTINDDLVFAQATGTFPIRVTSVTLDPATMTFTGGATYDFLRASTSLGSGNSPSGGNANGWQSLTSGAQSASPYNIAGPDSFGSVSFMDANATGGAVTLGTSPGVGFTGKVIYRARPVVATANNTPYTIFAGTLEIHDGGVLGGTNLNQPSVTLSGGNLSVAVDTGNYGFLTGSTSPSSSQLGGTLLVNSSSTISNPNLDAYGNARRLSTLWSGPVNILPGNTLTVNTGGGTVLSGSLLGTGTVKIGAADPTLSNASSAGANILRIGAAGSTTNTYDLGSSGTLQTAANSAATANLAAVIAPTGTWITGSSANGTGAAPANAFTTIAIGINNSNSNIGGTITNGVVTNNGGGAAPGTAPGGAASNNMTNLSKVGNGALTLASRQYHNGANSVTAGSLIVANNHALGDGSAPVTVAGAAASIDLNGTTPAAGKSYVLSGGSLLNNNTGAASTLTTGASASWAIARTIVTATNGAVSTTATLDAGSGLWQASQNFGAATTVANSNANAGTPATIAISGGGGSGATATAILQLAWLRAGSTNYNATPTGAPTAQIEGNVGTGYVTPPKIIFSAPDLPGGRPIRVSATIGSPGNATVGQVTGFTIVDPGFGYTSIPTITIDNSGTGGSGFAPLFAMTLAAIDVTNAGSGYTSAPTLAFGGTGFLATAQAYSTKTTSGVTANAFANAPSAVSAGGFGSVTLTSATTSSVGGAGNITIAPIVSGAGNLKKVGNGAVTLSNVNSYSGTSEVFAGILYVNGSTAVSSAFTVDATGTLSGTGNVQGTVNALASSFIAPGSAPATIGTLAEGATTLAGSLLVDVTTGVGAVDLLNVSGNLNIGSGTVNFNALGALDQPAYVFANYTSLTGGAFATVSNLPSGYTINYNYLAANQIALVVVPEPTSLALIGMGAMALITRRRRARKA